MAKALLILSSLLIAACAEPMSRPVAPMAPTKGENLNPKTASGQPIYLGFGNHHPDCFTFEAARTVATIIPCPAGVMRQLGECRGGDLLRVASGCRCVPIADEPISETPCPK